MWSRHLGAAQRASKLARLHFGPNRVFRPEGRERLLLESGLLECAPRVGAAFLRCAPDGTRAAARNRCFSLKREVWNAKDWVPENRSLGVVGSDLPGNLGTGRHIRFSDGRRRFE